MEGDYDYEMLGNTKAQRKFKLNHIIIYQL